MSKRWWSGWLRVAQVLGTIGFIILLLRSVEWPATMLLLRDLSWADLLVSTNLLVLAHLVNVARWHFLLQRQAIGYGKLLVYYGAGLFSSNFLPTGIGGDGVRIVLLSRRVALGAATLSVTLDRLIGLVALTALFMIGSWFGTPLNFSASFSDGSMIRNYYGISVLAAFAGGIVVVSVTWWLFPDVRIPLRRLARLMGLSDMAAQWQSRKLGATLIGSYLYSVGSHLLLVGAYWFVLRSLNIEVSVGAAVWLVILVSLSMLAPVSLNGLGLQESVFVMALGSYGVSLPQALGGALLIRFLTLFCSLLGGLLFLLRDKSQSIEQRKMYERTS